MPLTPVLLYLHIAAGGLGLALGTWLVAARKGTGRHRRVGRVYAGALLLSASLSIPLALRNGNYFLALVGIFTLYMVGSGWRAIRRREARVQAVDWMLTIGMGVFGGLLAVLGIRNLIAGNTFGTVLVVFGAISLAFVVLDCRAFTGRATVANRSVTMHLQRMLGSYIASLTAFLVVNNTVLPGVVAWLLPTAIVTPLIFRWSAKWARREPPLPS